MMISSHAYVFILIFDSLPLKNTKVFETRTVYFKIINILSPFNAYNCPLVKAVQLAEMIFSLMTSPIRGRIGNVARADQISHNYTFKVTRKILLIACRYIAFPMPK